MKSRVYIVAGVLYLFAYILLEWIFDSSPILDKASYIGIATSMIGLPIAIHQILRVKSSAHAAQNAAESASESFKQSMVSFEFGRITKLVDEIKDLLKRDSFEAATLRIRDLREATVKLKQRVSPSPGETSKAFQSYVVEFNKVENLLLKDRNLSQKAIDNLSEFTNFVHELSVDAIHAPTWEYIQ